MALKSFAVSLISLGLLGLAHLCAKPNAYTIIDLGPTPSRVDTAYRVSEDGRVAGCFLTPEGRTQAALWHEGKRTELETPAPFGDSQALGFSAAGEPIGYVFDRADDRRRRAVVWREGKPVFLEAAAMRHSAAQAGASGGVIIGQAETDKGQVQAALWRNGAIQFLGVLDKGDSSAANDVNDAGQIVGFSDTTPNGKNRACLWEKGVLRELPPLSGGATAQARALNQKGQVIGWSDAHAEGLHAVLWQDGRPQDLGTLGDEPSAAWGINDNGEIVGGSAVNERVYHAFLYRDGKMTDLNAALPPDSGWTLRLAQSINNKGQIVGIGQFRRERRAFLLTPK